MWNDAFEEIPLVRNYHKAYLFQGADNVIYERLQDGDNDLRKRTREHLEQFGAAGLRTLCLAYRDLTPDMYEKWNEKFIQAKSSLRDREKKLDEVSIVSTIALALQVYIFFPDLQLFNCSDFAFFLH